MGSGANISKLFKYFLKFKEFTFNHYGSITMFNYPTSCFGGGANIRLEETIALLAQCWLLLLSGGKIITFMILHRSRAVCIIYSCEK